MSKKIFLVLSCAMMLCVAASPALRAGPALVAEVATGTVLHAHDPLRRWYPASLTKLMTIYILLREMEAGRLSPDSPVRLSERSKQQPFNMMDWPAGTEIPLSEAIPLLTVKSANDVAVAVAETASGSVEAFVEEMNETAARIGMTDTVFANPNGIHNPGHYSTARDLALLAVALARDFPQHEGYFALRQTEAGGQVMRNYNPLLGSFRGADGMKTGYVCESGYVIVASATREQRRLIAVVLGAVSEEQRAEIAAKLLDYGFAEETGETQLQDLAAPEPPGGPVDMRPYVCGGRPLPDDLAGFGIEAAPAPLPRSKP